MASSDGIGNLVASHYNQLEEKGREVRQDSRIFFMRNFNNWVKSVLINDATRRLDSDRPISVFDLGCGKGGDLQKWDKARVGKIVCSDIAKTSLDQCKERYDSRRRNYTAEFVHADATKDKIKDRLSNKNMEFDLVSSQFVLHYSFESLQQANQFLENVSSNLKPGGYFIGTTTDGNEIMRRLTVANMTNSESQNLAAKEGKRDRSDEIEIQGTGNQQKRKADDSEDADTEEADKKKQKTEESEPEKDTTAFRNLKFGNAVYSVEFDKDTPLAPPKLFGTKYNFHLQEVVDCPEFLVNFSTLVKLAARHRLKLIMKSRFEDYITHNLFKHKGLLSVINCLEVYPNEKLVGNPETDYDHVKKEPQGEGKTFGTLSKDEWEAMTLYCAFIFQKESQDSSASL